MLLLFCTELQYVLEQLLTEINKAVILVKTCYTKLYINIHLSMQIAYPT